MFICLFIRILEPLHGHIIKAARALSEISGTETEFTRQIGLELHENFGETVKLPQPKTY